MTKWPLLERPREKLLLHGAHILSDAELIALIIQTGCKGKTAVDLARDALQAHDGLQTLFGHLTLTYHSIIGIGQAKLAALLAAKELGNRLLMGEITIGAKLNDSRKTQAFLAQRLQGYKNEIFACLFLDTHFKLLKYAELFQGTVNEATIYPREIIRQALLVNAAKVILAHNHPSGDPTPSAADRDVTQLIQHALAIMDIRLIDHVIIGRGKNYSFTEAQEL